MDCFNNLSVVIYETGNKSLSARANEICIFEGEEALSANSRAWLKKGKGAP